MILLKKRKTKLTCRVVAVLILISWLIMKITRRTCNF